MFYFSMSQTQGFFFVVSKSPCVTNYVNERMFQPKYSEFFVLIKINSILIRRIHNFYVNFIFNETHKKLSITSTKSFHFLFILKYRNIRTAMLNISREQYVRPE